MIPYGTFLFFFIIAILLLPSVILGLRGKRSYTYNMIVTVVFLLLIFSSHQYEAYALIFFTIWQVLLIKGYATYRKRANSSVIFSFIILLSILPLLLSKFSSYLSISNLWGFLGISYITFKSTQIIMEIRDGLIKKHLSIVQLLYFILFFPTISSGPIDRFRRFEKDLNAGITKEQYKVLLYDGINKIFL